MTKEQLDRISAQLVGHLYTDANFRSRLHEAFKSGRDDAIARLINETVKPETNVTPEDFPQLREEMARRIGSAQASSRTFEVRPGPGWEEYGHVGKEPNP